MKFALVVPVGAFHPFLEATLASLAAQTEHVAVALMDASGDERVRKLAETYTDLITFAQHGPDEGQADAIATGWRKIDGDVLGWLNADDRLYPDALTHARVALETGADVVYGQSTIIDTQERMTGWQYAVEPPSERLSHAAVISQPSCFFRRTLHDKVGGLDRSLHYTMDWDLFVRMYKASGRFAFEDRALSQVLWADDTKTSSLGGARRKEIKRMLELHSPNTMKFKSMLGFGVQNVIDSAPTGLKRLLLRRLMKEPQPLNGLLPDGTCTNQIRLPLCHYRDRSVHSASLHFAGPAPEVRAQVNGQPRESASVGQSITITLPQPLEAATSCSVTLSIPGDHRPTFLYAELLD
ncbi:MAG: glycosyltransferase [Pseudomonadota bacterium]